MMIGWRITESENKIINCIFLYYDLIWYDTINISKKTLNQLNLNDMNLYAYAFNLRIYLIIHPICYIKHNLIW